MRLRLILILLLVLVAGALLYLLYAQSLDPDEYHTTPMAAFLDEDLYGGSKAIDELPLLKPFVYVQAKNKGEPNGYLLNVLIPVPEGTSVDPVTIDTSTPGIFRAKYRATSSATSGPVAGLYHQTLIHVDQEIETIIVECTMGGSSGSSTIGTTDADDEDPISGGAATPYMCDMTPNGLMLYTGSDACSVTMAIPAGSGGPTTHTLPASPPFQRFVAASPDFTSFEVGKRTIKGVR
jgi:hypothetical protein